MSNKPLTQHTLWVAPNPTGGARCNLYLVPEPMRPGQSPSDLYQRLGSTWRHVGTIEQDFGSKNANFRIVTLESAFEGMKEDLLHTMGGSHFAIVLKEDGKYCYPEDIEVKPARPARVWDNDELSP